jgi:hypothetical protein
MYTQPYTSRAFQSPVFGWGGGAFQSPVTRMYNYNQSDFNVRQGNNNRQSMYIDNQGGNIYGGVRQNQSIWNGSSIYNRANLNNSYDYRSSAWGGDCFPQQGRTSYFNYSPMNYYFNYNQTTNQNNWFCRPQPKPYCPPEPVVCPPPKQEIPCPPPKQEIPCPPPKQEIPCPPPKQKPPKPPVCPPSPPPVCPPPLTPINQTARIWGDPHIEDADGGKYDVQTTGYHNLLTDDNFRIIGNFVKGNPNGDVTTMKEAGLVLGDNRMMLTPDGKVVYNGAAQTWGDNNQLSLNGFGTLTRNGNDVKLKANEYDLGFNLNGGGYLDLLLGRDVAPINAGREQSPTGLLGETFDAGTDAQNAPKLGLDKYLVNGIYG